MELYINSMYTMSTDSCQRTLYSHALVNQWILNNSRSRNQHSMYFVFHVKSILFVLLLEGKLAFLTSVSCIFLMSFLRHESENMFVEAGGVAYYVQNTRFVP